MAAPSIPLTFTPYERRYRQAVRDLLFRSDRSHTHLDWYETDHWLNSNPPMRLAWQRGRLIGLLAASEPLNHSCWLRLAAIHNQFAAESVFQALWEDLSVELRALDIHLVALLGLRDWVADMMQPLGFVYREDVVTLRRANRQLPEPPANRVLIRSFKPDDMEIITLLDHAAFAPPWQLSQEELAQAARLAAVCTVALLDGEIVGYQLSTLYYEGGHLARLGVQPSVQGNGVGGALLNDLMHRFARRGMYGITVNTQSTNHRSQRLYTRFDFHPTGYNLPVWTATL
jgi:[ribosomal protein S18]-alanine N-acetyltransferase